MESLTKVMILLFRTHLNRNKMDLSLRLLTSNKIIPLDNNHKDLTNNHKDLTNNHKDLTNNLKDLINNLKDLANNLKDLANNHKALALQINSHNNLQDKDLDKLHNQVEIMGCWDHQMIWKKDLIILDDFNVYMYLSKTLLNLSYNNI